MMILYFEYDKEGLDTLKIKFSAETLTNLMKNWIFYHYFLIHRKWRVQTLRAHNKDLHFVTPYKDIRNNYDAICIEYGTKLSTISNFILKLAHFKCIILQIMFRHLHK